MIDILQDTPETNEPLRMIKTSVYALLTLSSLHCTRFGLERNIKGGTSKIEKIKKRFVNSSLHTSNYAIKKKTFLHMDFPMNPYLNLFSEAI